jgi:MYXO-CTERM domain-containing protein
MVAELDVVPGKPEESSLMKRMLLPMSNDDRMPPTDKPQATPAEIEAVRAWIAKGARRDQSVDAHELPPELLASVERKTGVADKGALAVVNPNADHKDKAPDSTPPPAVPPAGAKGCATCSVGGERDASTVARSLAVAGLLALAYAARRSGRRSRR